MLPRKVSKSSKLTSAQKSYLKSLKKGDVVQFTAIKAKMPNGEIRQMSNISVPIK